MTENLPAKVPLVAREDGLLVARDIDEAWRMAGISLKSNMLPERYKTQESVLVASQYAIELGLKPLSGMSKIAMVKGTPCLFGDGPLGLCQSKGLVENIEEVYLDKDMNVISLANKNLSAPVFAAVCTVKRRGDSKQLETFFTMAEADSAGLTKPPSSGPGPWQKYPKRMLKYRARSQALKDKFADCLNGMPIAEYDFNTIDPEIIELEQDANGQYKAAPPTPPAAPGTSSVHDKLRRKGAISENPIVDGTIEE